MNAEIVLTALSSSVIAGTVGAVLAGWFNLRSKQNDYENAYFKLVLDRRINAYDQVANLVTQIKVAVVDSDRRPYHLLFSDSSSLDNVYKILYSVMSSALWLSDDLFDETRKLNMLVFQQSQSEEDLIEFAKCNYRSIAEMRTRIEVIHARDMLVLHKIPKFLRGKKPTDSYTDLPETQ